jgi:hypothetical protein
MRKNRNDIKYPESFMKVMKQKKKKAIRNTPIDEDIIEQKFNNAAKEL